MIVAAAIRINGAVISMARPARHHDIVRQINGLYEPGDRPGWTYEREEQGFIDHNGEFLDRRQALRHVEQCGQSKRTPPMPACYRGDELFSEDLW